MSDSRRLVDRLTDAVGAEHLSTGGGMVAVRPGTVDEVVEVIRAVAAAGRGLTVGPSAPPGAVALDLERLAAVLHVDETSGLCHVQVGIRLGSFAGELSPRGLFVPLPARHLGGRTVGAALAAPRPEEASPGGPFVGACAALSAVLADGTSIQTRLAPRRASGPDLDHAFLGARGRTGVLVSAWLRLRRKSPVRRYAGFAFRSPERALVSAYGLLDRGARPIDAAIAGGALVAAWMPGSAIHPGETLLALRFDGVEGTAAAEETLAGAVASGAEGRTLLPSLAAAWLERGPGGPVRRPQRFLPRRELAAALVAAGPRGELDGLRPEGAALLVDQAQERAPDPLAALTEALYVRLDPGGLFDVARSR